MGEGPGVRGLCRGRGLVPRGRPDVGAACLPGSGRRRSGWEGAG